MTLFKSLFIQTRLLVTLLALALYTGPLRSETDVILVSDLPISDLLTHLEAPKHLGDAALTFSFSVTNDTDAPALWYLHSEVLEPIAFQMFAAGQSAPVFQSPFAARVQKSHASQGPILRSDLIILPPRERLEITARFEQAAVAKPFPIRLDFKEVLDDQDKRRLLSHGTFLGAMVAFIVMFLLSPNFLMNAASRWFAIYLASMTLLAMHSHGYGFSLFDLSPHIYFAVLRVLHTGVMLGYILFVLSFLNASKSYPLFWRCALVYIAFGLTTAVLEQVLASPAFQYAPILVPLFFVGFGAVGAYLALRDRLHGARFLAAGYAVLLVGGLVNYVASFPPLAQWNDVIDQVTMLLQAGDAVIFGGALLSQMYGMRRMRDLAVEAQMTEMQRRLDLNAKLRSTKGDLRRARDLAERHRANLAETSHDLRQPITSLRMALQSAQSRSPESVSDLSAGIDFLDKLLVQTLEESHPSTGRRDTRSRPGPGHGCGAAGHFPERAAHVCPRGRPKRPVADLCADLAVGAGTDHRFDPYRFKPCVQRGSVYPAGSDRDRRSATQRACHD